MQNMIADVYDEIAEEVRLLREAGHDAEAIEAWLALQGDRPHWQVWAWLVTAEDREVWLDTFAGAA